MPNPAPLLARGRAAAEALMVDTVLIERLASSTTDPDTGQVTATYTTMYSGRGKFQQAAPAAAPSTVGEAAVFIGQLLLHLPAATVGVRPDDRVTAVASVNDPDLTGRVFRARGPAHKSFATAHRYPLVEVTG